MKKYTLKNLFFWSWMSFVLGFSVMFLIVKLSISFYVGEDTGFNKKVATMKNILERNFYEEIDPEKMTDAALKGMTDSTGDVYTRYFNKQEWASLLETVNGSYVGIGITMVVNDKKQIEIIEVNAGSPAEQAGIKLGDIILSVNGNEIKPDSMDKIIEIVKQSEEVKLKVQRKKTALEFTVKTTEIKVQNVDSKVIEDDIGYVKISTFDNTIADAFKKEVESLQTKKIRGLLIDVRDNPGGNYDQVVEICDFLLGECKIVYTQNKDGEQNIEYSDAEHCDLPIVLLINGDSASASEVLAGALRDNKRAVLVGRKSFGKGLVQGTIDLQDGTGVAVTVSRYYTPSGECIHEKGIEPDIKVADNDKMQEKIAIKKLKELIKDDK